MIGWLRDFIWGPKRWEYEAAHPLMRMPAHPAPSHFLTAEAIKRTVENYLGGDDIVVTAVYVDGGTATIRLAILDGIADNFRCLVPLSAGFPNLVKAWADAMRDREAKRRLDEATDDATVIRFYKPQEPRP